MPPLLTRGLLVLSVVLWLLVHVENHLDCVGDWDEDIPPSGERQTTTHEVNGFASRDFDDVAGRSRSTAVNENEEGQDHLGDQGETSLDGKGEDNGSDKVPESGTTWKKREGFGHCEWRWSVHLSLPFVDRHIASLLDWVTSYEGQWKAGRKHGRGLFSSFSGWHYDGDWMMDGRNGYGAMFFSSPPAPTVTSCQVPLPSTTYMGPWIEDTLTCTKAGGGCLIDWHTGYENVDGASDVLVVAKYHGEMTRALPHGPGELQLVVAMARGGPLLVQLTGLFDEGRVVNGGDVTVDVYRVTASGGVGALECLGTNRPDRVDDMQRWARRKWCEVCESDTFSRGKTDDGIGKGSGSCDNDNDSGGDLKMGTVEFVFSDRLVRNQNGEGWAIDGADNISTMNRVVEAMDTALYHFEHMSFRVAMSQTFSFGAPSVEEEIAMKEEEIQRTAEKAEERNANSDGRGPGDGMGRKRVHEEEAEVGREQIDEALLMLRKEVERRN